MKPLALVATLLLSSVAIAQLPETPHRLTAPPVRPMSKALMPTTLAPLTPVHFSAPLAPSASQGPTATKGPVPSVAPAVQQDSYTIAAVDPTMQNNPAGSGFPGFRGGQQLVLYTPAYGQPSTGTNEFGFEVTVVNNRVIAQEGANSGIPLQGDGNQTFVISGHGRARNWLIANAPVGAVVTRSGNQLLIQVSPDSYVYQLQHRLDEVADRIPGKTRHLAEKQLGHFRQRLAQNPQDAHVISDAQQALANLNDAVWQHMPRFSSTAIRGAWHRPVERTIQAIGQKLDQLQHAGINTVFLETFYHGYTIFPSQTYQAYDLPTPYPQFASTGFDVLDAWLTQAHQRGMQVHVWFQTFYGGNKALHAPGPILSKYPQWANVQRIALTEDGQSPAHPVPSNVETGHYFLDPANPDVTGFLQKLLAEIATRYPVDGIQLDYIRYASSFPIHRYSYLKTTWGYTPVARQAFISKTGVDPASLTPGQNLLWQQWMHMKTNWVSQFVKQASQTVRQARPDIKLSAAVFPGLEDSLVKKHQDWATWAQNGWIDFLAPMTLTSATKVVHDDTRRMIAETGNRVPVVSGLFGAFNGNTSALLLDQVYQAKLAGANGVCLFDTAHLTPSHLRALSLSTGVNKAGK
jgi:uncharacterized lipoprotein YddW (UPF0748 family)